MELKATILWLETCRFLKHPSRAFPGYQCHLQTNLQLYYTHSVYGTAIYEKYVNSTQRFVLFCRLGVQYNEKRIFSQLLFLHVTDSLHFPKYFLFLSLAEKKHLQSKEGICC
jgi:hypothetical protein